MTWRMTGRNHDDSPRQAGSVLCGTWSGGGLLDLVLVLQAQAPSGQLILEEWRRGLPDALIVLEAARQVGCDVHLTRKGWRTYTSPVECKRCQVDPDACWVPVVSPLVALHALHQQGSA